MTAVNYLWNPINDNIVEEFDDGGNTIAEYTTEPDEFGDVISQYRDGQERFYHSDGQGSTLALTNANGDVTDTYAYSAFGEVTSRTGTTVNPFQYIGQNGYYRDEETGDYEVRRRPFNVGFTRWSSVDALLNDMYSHFGRTFGQHNYRYVDNSPLNKADFSGLVPVVYKPGTGTCNTTTAGINYVAGRGLFKIATLGEFEPNPTELNKIGSSFFTQWKQFGPAFVTKEGCCCCTQVGYLQTVRSVGRYDILGVPFPFSGWDINGVDKGVPYPHADTTDPCPVTGDIYDPTRRTAITLRDNPNYWEYKFAGVWNPRLKYSHQLFETCVICLEGVEGIVETLVHSGLDIIRGGLKQMTVYGCVKWGHVIMWDRKTSRYVYRRIVDEVEDPGKSNKTGLAEKKNFAGTAPSEEWRAAVEGHYSGVITW